MTSRSTVVTRETKETAIRIEIGYGAGEVRADTGEPFLDHMLVTLGRYAGLDLSVEARGDLRHHLIEDVAITLGGGLAAIVPPACARYGDRVVPMDEALVHVSIDVGGRPYYAGRLPSSLYDHWLRSFADNARATLHVRVLRGRDRHHIVEAAFKALGLALRQALEKGEEVFSTKGTVAAREKGRGKREETTKEGSA
jgi:imidazoleglycerol-phosphate dehydratase